MEEVHSQCLQWNTYRSSLKLRANMLKQANWFYTASACKLSSSPIFAFLPFWANRMPGLNQFMSSVLYMCDWKVSRNYESFGWPSWNRLCQVSKQHSSSDLKRFCGKLAVRWHLRLCSPQFPPGSLTRNFVHVVRPDNRWRHPRLGVGGASQARLSRQAGSAAGTVKRPLSVQVYSRMAPTSVTLW